MSEPGVIDNGSALQTLVVTEPDIDAWLGANFGYVQAMLVRDGALLVRGLPILASRKLEKVLGTLFGAELLDYNYPSTPRTQIRGHIYTSTEYPSTETIPLHNENAYTRRWPMQIAFYCVKPAESGGATPIADSGAVHDEIPERIRDRFAAQGLMYVRNYGAIDLPWEQVFGTADRGEVEAFCERSEIEYEWLDPRRLRTRQRVAAVREHPVTRQRLWFNQAHLFHISALGADARSTLTRLYEKEDLPRNVYYANGNDIDVEDLEVIRRAYAAHMTTFQWREGDLLLLDNMRFAHGRLPFTGTRRVLVGMAREMRCDQAPAWREARPALAAVEP